MHCSPISERALLLEGSHTSLFCPSVRAACWWTWERWTGRMILTMKVGGSKHSETNLPQYHLVHHKSHTDINHKWVMRWRSWFRHCDTRRKFASSISDGVIRIFHWLNPVGRTMTLRSTTQPLTNEYQRYLLERGGGGGLKVAGAQS
jgi:hypothetical protein